MPLHVLLAILGLKGATWRYMWEGEMSGGSTFESFSRLDSYRNGNEPEKQQECLLDAAAGFSFFAGAFCALLRIFFAPLLRQLCGVSSSEKSLLESGKSSLGERRMKAAVGPRTDRRSGASPASAAASGSAAGWEQPLCLWARNASKLLYCCLQKPQMWMSGLASITKH